MKLPWPISTAPKPRVPVQHLMQNGVSLTEEARRDPALNALVGKTGKGKTIKVKPDTLDQLNIAEEVIQTVKTRCVPVAGNQATDIHKTRGWSHARAQAAKDNRMVKEGANSSVRAKQVMRYQAGTCNMYGVCTYAVLSEKIKALPPGHPLRAKPLHLVKDASEDHAYVVWGTRSKGRTGKFEGDAVIVDAWSGLAKPFLRREAATMMENLEKVGPSEEWTARGEDADGNFQLAKVENELRNGRPDQKHVSDEEIKDYLMEKKSGRDGFITPVLAPDRPGADVLGWVLTEQGGRNFIDDRVSVVGDVSTTYVDKTGRYGVFDHQNAVYLQDYMGARANATADVQDGKTVYARTENAKPGIG